MGAEFTWVYAHTFGSLKTAPTPSVVPVTPTRGSEASGAVVTEPVASVKSVLTSR